MLRSSLLLLQLLATASALSLQGSAEGAASSGLKTLDAPPGYAYVGYGHCEGPNDELAWKSRLPPMESSPENCAAICDENKICIGFQMDSNGCQWLSWRAGIRPAIPNSPVSIDHTDKARTTIHCYKKVNPIASADPVPSMATARVVCTRDRHDRYYANVVGCADLTTLGAKAGGSMNSGHGPMIDMTVYRWRNGTVSSPISMLYWDISGGGANFNTLNCPQTEWTSKCTHAFGLDWRQWRDDQWLVGDVLLLEEPPANWSPPAEGSGKSGSAARGDPHLVNIKGEAFDVMQTGNMMLLEIPRGSSPAATLDLALHADIERLGAVSCGPTFITSASLTGRWMGVPVEIRSGPITNKGISSKRSFAIRVDGKDWLPHAEMETTLELTKDATITARNRMFLFQVGGLDIAVSQPKRPRVFLDIQVKGLGNLKTEIGGLLGVDDHTSVEALPSACEGSASSLSLAAMAEGDEALQWAARALL